MSIKSTGRQRRTRHPEEPEQARPATDVTQLPLLGQPETATSITDGKRQTYQKTPTPKKSRTQLRSPSGTIPDAEAEAIPAIPAEKQPASAKRRKSARSQSTDISTLPPHSTDTPAHNADIEVASTLHQKPPKAGAVEILTPQVESLPDPVVPRETPLEYQQQPSASHLIQETLLAGMNPEQRAAVTTTSGPLIILAGPGSGKTRVVTHRIAWLIAQEHVKPWHILAVTFTNKAAKEMRERLDNLLTSLPAGVVPARTSITDLHVGTFHSICARVLRQEIETLDFGRTNRFTILDDDEQAAAIKSVMKRLNLDEKQFKPIVLRDMISRAKNNLLTVSMYESKTSKYIEEIAARVYRGYEEFLRTNDAVDFDDLIMLTNSIWHKNSDALQRAINRYHYIHVDEFQDCNEAQYRLVQMLATGRAATEKDPHVIAGQRNICIVGDEDQSIYSWRGASSENIRRFIADFPERQQVILAQNYRSTKTIVQAAMEVVQQNKGRIHKDLRTDNDQGEKIAVHEVYNEEAEGEFVTTTVRELISRGTAKYNDIAVMYRTNAQSRALEEGFIKRGIPYRIIGSRKFYERKEIRDVIAYLRLIHNARDSLSLRRIINVPARKIGEKTVVTLLAWADRVGGTVEEAIARIDEEGTLGAAAKTALKRFGLLIANLREASRHMRLEDLIDRILVDSGYAAELQAEQTEEGNDRWQNVQELRRVATDYSETDPSVALPLFLEQIALVGGGDIAQTASENPHLAEEAADAVTLITLHAAKGSEYPIVFLVGMEEGVLPHSRSIQSFDRSQIEEERRLAYVGITRAKRQLYLIHAFRRSFYGGDSMLQTPSRFIDDIPEELLSRNSLSEHRQASRRQKDDDDQRTIWEDDDEGAGRRYRSPTFAPTNSKEPTGKHVPAPFIPRDQRKYAGQRPTIPPSPSGMRRPYITDSLPDDPIPASPEVVQEQRPLRKGDTVRHRIFGKGLVMDVSGSADNLQVEVLFEREAIGRKVLDPRFAKMDIIG